MRLVHFSLSLLCALHRVPTLLLHLLRLITLLVSVQSPNLWSTPPGQLLLTGLFLHFSPVNSMGASYSHSITPAPTSQRWIGKGSSPAVQNAKVRHGQYVLPAPPPAGAPAPELLLGPLDGFCLRMWYVESTHFFDEALDPEAIQRSLAGLVERYPSFAGRPRKVGDGVSSLWSG